MIIVESAKRDISWFSFYFVRIEGRTFGNFDEEKSLVIQIHDNKSLEKAIKHAEKDFQELEKVIDFKFKKINYDVKKICGDTCFCNIPKQKYEKYITLKPK